MKSVATPTPRRDWILVVLLVLVTGLMAGSYLTYEQCDSLPCGKYFHLAVFKVQSVWADGSKVPGTVDATELLKQLESEDETERLASLEVIQQRSNRQWADQVLPALMTAVQHDSAEEVRYQAAVAITRMSCVARDAKPAMLQALGDSSGSVRTMAAGFLIKFGKEVEGNLVQQLKSPDAKRCAAAALALSHYEAAWLQQALPRLLALGQHQDQVVRQHVALALGHTAGESTLPLLKKMLHDPEDQVRANAVESLSRVSQQPTQTLATLKPLLQDESVIVKQSVLKALGHLPPQADVVETITLYSQQEQDPEMSRSIRHTCDLLEFRRHDSVCRPVPLP